jgi:hypothetical protein
MLTVYLLRTPLRNKELTALLKRLNCPSTGKKVELQERLITFSKQKETWPAVLLVGAVRTHIGSQDTSATSRAKRISTKRLREVFPEEEILVSYPSKRGPAPRRKDNSTEAQRLEIIDWVSLGILR